MTVACQLSCRICVHEIVILSLEDGLLPRRSCSAEIPYDG
jgi:hypothetical protein